MSEVNVAGRLTLDALRQRFEADWKASAHWRREAEEDYAFVEGSGQWSEDDKTKLAKQRRPALVFNEILPQIDLISGLARQQSLGYRAYPRGGEDALTAEIATACLAYAMERANGASELFRAHDDAAICGKGWIELGLDRDYTDDLFGEIYVGRVRPTAIVEDMSAERLDRQDAEHIAKAVWYPEAAFLRRWPEHADAFRLGDWLTSGRTPIDGWSVEKQQLYWDRRAKLGRVLFMWYKVPKALWVMTDTLRGGQKNFETSREVEDFYRTAAKTMPPDMRGQRVEKLYPVTKIATWSLRVATLVGWRVLEDAPSPFTRSRLFPFVPMLVHNYTDEPFGVVRNIKDPQREINKRMSTLLHIVMTTANSGWKVKKESLSKDQLALLKEMGAAPGLVAEYSGNVAPQEILPKPLPNAFMELASFMKASIREITSVNAEMAGQTTQVTISGEAIKSRQRGGMVALQGVTDAFAYTRLLVGQRLLSLIQEFYPVEKIQRILGDLLLHGGDLAGAGLPSDPDLLQDRLRGDEAIALFTRVKQSEYDISIFPSAQSPSVRGAQFAEIMDLVRSGFPVPPDLILDMSDIPGKTRIKQALRKQGNQLGPTRSGPQAQAPTPGPM